MDSQRQVIFAPVAFAMGMVALPTNAATWYVAESASTSNGCCTSAAACGGWADACPDLRAVLLLALAGDQVRVAAGTYHPDSGTGDRTLSFVLNDQVEVLGGYPAGGGAVRDPHAHHTILRGDLDEDDDCGCGTQTGYAENSYHVVTTNGAVSSATVLDGFIVEHGYATGTVPDERGAGIYNPSGSLTLRDCLIRENWASHGAGMYNGGGSPVILDSHFVCNRAEGLSSLGGGMHNSGATVTVERCEFRENYTRNVGGGMYNSNSSVAVTDCQFLDNAHLFMSGAGMFNTNGSTATLLRCTFKGNGYIHGAGVYNAGASALTVDECDFLDNLAGFAPGNSGNGACIFSTAGSTVLARNSTFVGNTARTGSAGIHVNSAIADVDVLTIENCTFAHNESTEGGDGAAVYTNRVVLTIADSDFLYNAASQVGGGEGGAIYAGSQRYAVTRCNFVGNYAGWWGGAVAQGNDGEFRNCVFYANKSEFSGGAVVFRFGTSFDNCLFVGNQALGTRTTGNPDGGGAIYFQWTNAAGIHSATVHNCTFSGNTAANRGGAIYGSFSGGDTVTVINSILWNNSDSLGTGCASQLDHFGATLVADHCCIEGEGVGCNYTDAGGNIGGDPRFLRDPSDGGDGWDVGNNDDFGNLRLDCRVAVTSPCINAGDQTLLPADGGDLDNDLDTSEALPLDLDDNTRVVGAEVDIGAYEVQPSVSEVCCDGIDNDCDGNADCDDADCVADSQCADADGDTYVACLDCLDTDPNTHPGVTNDLCDGIDNDCDGTIDEDDWPVMVWPDADGDGFGDLFATPVLACAGPGLVVDATDCDDSDPSINPTGIEVCNGLDDNCDCDVDEGLDGDGDGFTPCAGDCNDNSNAIFPGATEIPDDGIDQDCNGADTITCFVDADMDGHGTDAGTTTLADDGSCDTAQMESTTSDDCNDGDASIYPGAAEIPDDGIDQDCNGFDTVSCFEDRDGDGFGSTVVVLSDDGDCEDPGESTDDSDCDDSDPAVNPAAAENCSDGVDNDCDGFADCDDSDCDEPSCCNDGNDNDGDGCVDGVDSDCGGTESDCTNGLDDDCDGLIDCDDTDCDETNCCSDGVDNDGDGCLDGADSDCGGGETVCTDGMDEDCDGLTDCDDGDCASAPPCIPTEPPGIPPYPHDRRKNRYISFDPNKADNDGKDVAFKVVLKQLSLGSCSEHGGFCREDRGASDCNTCSIDGNPCINQPIDCAPVPPQSCDSTGEMCLNDAPDVGGTSVGRTWWLGPESPFGNGVHLLVSEPFRKVSDDWPVPTHAGDCEVVPEGVYGVRAVGVFLGDESEEFEVETTLYAPSSESWWGDLTGPLKRFCGGDIRGKCDGSGDLCRSDDECPAGQQCVFGMCGGVGPVCAMDDDCTPPLVCVPSNSCSGDADCTFPQTCFLAWTLPDGSVNFDDISAAITVFAPSPISTPAELLWVDLHGNNSGTPGSHDFDPPNFVANVADIQNIVFGFQGLPYKGHDPADCPDAATWP